MSSNDKVIAAYERILAGVARLPPAQEQAPTFLEIAGYPHLENVASNILRFFLQPQGPHNLKGLVLESLLALLNVSVEDIKSAEVSREVTTQRGNRIDLVVESETFILGIENKIYHGVHNDLADYWNFLERHSEGRTPYGVLLALNLPPPTVPLHHFHAISYPQLLDQIEVRLGEASLTAHEPYTVFLKDWMQTMRGLTESTALSSQVLTLFSKHQDDIQRLLQEVDQLKAEMRRKVKALADLLVPDAQAIPTFAGHGLWRDSTRLVDVLGLSFDGSDGLVVSVAVVVEPAGWRIELHNQQGSIRQVERWLAARSIAFRVRPGKEYRAQFGDALPYTTELIVVKEMAQELFAKIRG
jgi:hypothetical protein